MLLIEKLARLNRERIPERVAHARGSGAFGYFEVTNDLSNYTKAKFLNEVGKKTKVACRLSTNTGEKGSPDLVRDIKGFAAKFYTEDGIYDLLSINFESFPIRDPIKQPDLFHATKNNPQTGMPDVNTTFDFFSFTPEALNSLTSFYQDKIGLSLGYRHMDAHAIHTYKWVNAKGEVHFVKYHLISEQGTVGLSTAEA